MTRRSDEPAKEGRTPDGFLRGGFLRGGPPRGSVARRSLILLAGGGVLALAVLSQLGENGVLAWIRLRHQERELADQVTRLELKNQDMHAKIQSLLNDPAELERFARVELSMQRKDEEVVRMVSDRAQED